MNYVTCSRKWVHFAGTQIFQKTQKIQTFVENFDFEISE